MSQNEKISVVIPVYNVQDMLSRCLDSVLNNTYSDLEIICIDDGSTDESLQILKYYENKDSRIKVYSKKNGGISSARNEGLRHCSAELIAFIDSDDWIHKEYFSCLHKIQKKGNYDVVICNHLRTMDSKSMEFEIESCSFNEMDRSSFMSASKIKGYVWGRLYKRSCIEGILFQEDEKIEDAVYNLCVALNNSCLKVAYVDLPLYAYFIREKSLVSTIERVDIYKLAKKLYNCAMEEKDLRMKEVLYIDCLKRSLITRYYFGLYKDKEEKKNSHLLAKNCLKKINGNKIKYIILVYIPILYRIFRIIDDPTMLQYEKNVRKSLK